ncbi:MAG: glycosyltransferase, partial [Acidobacteriota bacterium]
ALWLPAGAPVVGNIAALVPHKGQRYLVDAASVVVRAVRETQILIFGEGELRHALTRQIKDLGLEHNVRLIGFRPDVISLLKSLDVFVMSSTSEGLGTSILDAMAASRVVVATTAGGIPEIVEHEVTGLLVAAQRAAPLAEAIIRLLENPDERARMGHCGLARVRERFTADQMVDATLAVYHCVAGTPHVADNGSQPPSA